jgi:hypothetical protein
MVLEHSPIHIVLELAIELVQPPKKPGLHLAHVPSGLIVIVNQAIYHCVKRVSCYLFSSVHIQFQFTQYYFKLRVLFKRQAIHAELTLFSIFASRASAGQLCPHGFCRYELRGVKKTTATAQDLEC